MIAALVTIATWLASGPPDLRGTTTREVEGLHEQATAHYNEGRFHDAVEYWLLAEAKRQDVRYEVNLAKSYYALFRSGQGRDDLIECFRWTEHVLPRRYELPDEPPTTWATLAQCAQVLSEGRAILSIQLEAAPADAAVLVTLNGRPWAPPWHTSPTGTASHVSVMIGDSVFFDGTVDHPIGKHSTKRIVMAAPRSPSAPPPLVVALTPEPSLGTRPDAPESVSPWRWATLGTGLVLSAVGAGLVGHAYTLQADLEEANSRYAAGTLGDADYLTEYGDAERQQAIVYPTGITVLSMGAASLVAAIVLFSLEDDDLASATVTPAFLGADAPIGVIGRF
ncbi:MAG: hypothetical protein IV100_08915 [Myxococcales bacterium]|nr:hypothetical protein [Myxococcales bacterium]